MKKIISIITALILFSASAIAFPDISYGDGANSAPESSTQAQLQKCLDKPLIIEIDGYKIKAKREGLHITLADGSRLEKLDRQCNQEEISDVVLATWPYFEIGNLSYPNLNTIYDVTKDIIEKKKSETITLKSGIQSFDSYIYVFPKELAPTGSEQPVTYWCSRVDNLNEPGKTANCKAGYVHPNGLLLRYKFFRKRVSEGDYLSYDQSQRQKLESLIVQVPGQKKSSTQASQKKCGEVEFKIGMINYQIDPSSKIYFNWKDLGDKDHSNKEIRSRTEKCENINLGEIKSFVTSGERGIAITSGNESIATLYQRYKTIIEEKRKQNALEAVSNGIEKLIVGKDELYILPSNIALTGNEEPVVLECKGNSVTGISSTAWCAINFMHPDGNYIGENINREKFPENKILEAYNQVLKTYESYKYAKGEKP